MQDEKYVVFKKSDIDLVLLQDLMESNTTVSLPVPIDDAVVIRTQDIFAAGGLSAYAHQINVFLQHAMSEDDASALEEIRDYFLGVAQEAEDRMHRGECKVPD